MIEILITVVVVAVGLLGVAGMQITGMRATNDAHQQTLATQLAQDIMERVRANRLGAAGGAYSAITLDTTSSVSSPDCAAGNCTPAELADYDQVQWVQMIAPATGAPILPDTVISLVSANNNDYTGTLQWGPSSARGTLNFAFSL